MSLCKFINETGLDILIEKQAQLNQQFQVNVPSGRPEGSDCGNQCHRTLMCCEWFARVPQDLLREPRGMRALPAVRCDTSNTF